MKKFLYLCSACLFTYVSTAHARVEFIAQEGGVSFTATTTVSCPEGQRSYNGVCVNVCHRTEYPFTYALDETKGEVEKCSGVPNRWRYKECYADYVGNELGDCVSRDCSEFPLETGKCL